MRSQGVVVMSQDTEATPWQIHCQLGALLEHRRVFVNAPWEHREVVKDPMWFVRTPGQVVYFVHAHLKGSEVS